MSIALETGRAPPLGGDHGVAGRRWMHAVARPVRRWGAAHLLVEDRLERHERRAGMRRDPRRGRAPPVELREPAIIHRAGLEHARLPHDQPDAAPRPPAAPRRRTPGPRPPPPPRVLSTNGSNTISLPLGSACLVWSSSAVY